MIAIEQVRALFAQEAEVRMANLGELLLELEQTGGDAELVGSIFREVHTIKGSSAVAGLDDVSHCAHELEELLDDLRSQRRSVTPDVIDVLLAGADRLSAVIASDDGAPSVPAVGNGSHPQPEPAPVAEPEPVTETVPEKRAPSGEKSGLVMVPMERLDELVRLVGESATAHLRLGRMLKDQLGVDPASCAEFNDLSRSVNDLQDRAMRTRMVPVATITDQLHRAVRDLARTQNKKIRWDVRGGDTELDRGVLNQLSDSLLHLVRNAVDHGVESPAEREAAGKAPEATIRLHAMQLGSEVIIAVTDDGRGIDVEAVRAQAAKRGVDTDGMTEDELLRLTMHSGLSTTSFVTDVSGRGVGLDVVRVNVESARGRVEVRSQPAGGTEFRIVVPITLAVLRCLLVETAGQRFALPFHRVVLSQRNDPSAQHHAEGRPVVLVEGRPVPVSTLAGTIGLNATADVSGGSIVVLADTAHRHAFEVDRLVGQRDVVLKGLNRLLPHLPAVAGASVEPDGSVLVVLDPPGLIQRARHAAPVTTARPVADGAQATRRRILVVDDALTVRELQRSILERAGFDVRVANDGKQALSRLAEEPSDLVLTDIEMPNMDGFGLTEAIRAHPSLTNIPVLILSSRSSETDRQRGLDAGADGYIIKSGFDEGSLLAAVNRLLGARA
jgi:two-component system, chemotaxis family, sensor kinase CheA